ncbi:MAG: cobalt ECF transporter T component CbiQ [Chitinispirillaceae bacterium]|nr:cobalt ECF transporter T component CbiQ [Chitinispirillaceae bacterium]
MCKNKPRRKSRGFIDRTLLGVVALLKETVSHEEIAARPGFLQKRDPRLKVFSIALLLACALLTKSIIALGVLYAACLILAFSSAISAGAFFKRTLLFIPIFSVFIVIPAIFNIVTPGDPVLSITHSLSITRQGLGSAGIFFMRVLASVSLSILLVLTTRHHVLLKTLRVFKIPQLFVMTMGMTYRYIYLLLDIVQNTFIAIRSRVGFVTSTKTGRRIVGANMAGLWLKSYRMQTLVLDAMLSRGYTGEPKILHAFHARTTDFLMLIAAAAALTGTLWLNLSIH